MHTFEQLCLEYHRANDLWDTNGKIGTAITKAHGTIQELAMAYSPGVAYPCMAIHNDPNDVYEYTNKGNTVAVISDGSAVLGLGDIGARASKPVMEGKCLLFKSFAHIDATDIELSVHSVDAIVETVAAIADTFGGVNLEDIAAPQCFEIEERLKERCSVPIFHDDQHGTAIITSAGLLNVLGMSGKSIDSVRVIIIGAGAAGIACGKMYRALGVKHLQMFDSKGLLHTSREDLNAHKALFASSGAMMSLAEAMEGADMVLGLSRAGMITPEMVTSMAPNPIVFGCANPTPEIMPDLAKSLRSDLIIGTGRSDFPNQVNNVLGFPFIFRGALDVRATHITEGMKLAAARALAALAHEAVPMYVKAAHAREEMHFGPEYIIPSPFDRRLLVHVSSAVAYAAMEEGVAQRPLDMQAYRQHLETIAYEECVSS